MSATHFLGAMDVLYPRQDDYILSDPRFNAVSWYRMFPEEIGGLMSSLITSDYANIGPLYKDGKVIRRDLIDPVTLKKPDYTGMLSIRPTISSAMPFRAMVNAVALMSSPNISELNFINVMRAGVLGAEDYIAAWDALSDNDIAEFVHPEHGLIYRALKVGSSPIAYNLVKKLNILKERFVRLNRCVADEEIRLTDNFCSCVHVWDALDCKPAVLEPVGTGKCSILALTRKRDDARERMNELMNFIDDMRWLVKLYDSRL
jgi:hypothetical protein